MTIPKRILIIRTGGLGDFILSLPVMSGLRASWPDAEIQILGRPEIAALAGDLVSRITSIDDQRFARLFSDAPMEGSDPAAAYLSSFDVIVSFLGIAESDFGRKLTALVPRTLFIQPAAPGGRHAVEQFLASLRGFVQFIRAGSITAEGPREGGSDRVGQRIGGEAADPVATALGPRAFGGYAPGSDTVLDRRAPRIEIFAEDRAEGKLTLKQLLGHDDQVIIVHPGSGSRRKNWPPPLFAQTISLFQQAGHRTILLQGEADEEAVRGVLGDLRENLVPVLKQATVRQVAGVIACSRLVVGNDSGISHLAAAVGTPLVCLFGPTDPAVWRPLGTDMCVLMFEQATPERVFAEGLKLITRIDTD